MRGRERCRKRERERGRSEADEVKEMEGWRQEKKEGAEDRRELPGQERG